MFYNSKNFRTGNNSEYVEIETGGDFMILDIEGHSSY